MCSTALQWIIRSKATIEARKITSSISDVCKYLITDLDKKIKKNIRWLHACYESFHSLVRLMIIVCNLYMFTKSHAIYTAARVFQIYSHGLWNMCSAEHNGSMNPFFSNIYKLWQFIRETAKVNQLTYHELSKIRNIHLSKTAIKQQQPSFGLK